MYERWAEKLKKIDVNGLIEKGLAAERPVDELKPCPFCGGLVEIVSEGDYVEIVCFNCEIAMSRGTEKWLIADWNRRAGE